MFIGNVIHCLNSHKRLKLRCGCVFSIKHHKNKDPNNKSFNWANIYTSGDNPIAEKTYTEEQKYHPVRTHTIAVLRQLSIEGLFRIVVLDHALPLTNTYRERQWVDKRVISKLTWLSSSLVIAVSGREQRVLVWYWLRKRGLWRHGISHLLLISA